MISWACAVRVRQKRVRIGSEDSHEKESEEGAVSNVLSSFIAITPYHILNRALGYKSLITFSIAAASALC